MKKSIVRLTIVGILTLGLTLPAVASAGWFNWGCRYQGTWFGVVAAENPALLSGWMVTVEGKSYWHGTNNVQFTAVSLDPRLPIAGTDPVEYRYPTAVQVTTNRGNWMRTGFNTFAYTMTGFGLDAFGLPLYVATGNGTITLSENCNRALITAEAKVFEVVYDGFPFPLIPNPLIDPNLSGIKPTYTIPFPVQHAYRAFVDLQ